MERVKISIINKDFLKTACSIAFVKHVGGEMCSPEKAFDAILDNKLTKLYDNSEKEQCYWLNTENIFPFPKLCVLNFYDRDLPFTYSSLDSYARRMIRYALPDKSATSIATAIHGPNAGTDAAEALETLLSAFKRQFDLNKGDFGRLKEIILVEKNEYIFQNLMKRVDFVLDKKNDIIREHQNIFLNPEIQKGTLDSDYKRTESLLKHIFVAIPYQKKFNNSYDFGIKGAVEERKLKCERSDKENEIGDIVSRIKIRIATASLMIADVTDDNPNVLYEIGYADALNKDVILISQTRPSDRLPFDIRTRNCIFYDPEEISALKNKLGPFLDVALGKLNER